jgi:hypothetical protein
MQIEFYEETGHLLNLNKLVIHPFYKNLNYKTGYYRCNKSEFNRFDKLMNYTEKFPEIQKLLWINCDHILDYLQQYNDDILYHIQDFAQKYVREFLKKKWNIRLEITSLIWEYRKKHRLLDKQKYNNYFIIHNYILNKKKINRKDFNNIVNHIAKYIYKISQYDWFLISLKHFLNN